LFAGSPSPALIIYTFPRILHSYKQTTATTIKFDLFLRFKATNGCSHVGGRRITGTNKAFNHNKCLSRHVLCWKGGRLGCWDCVVWSNHEASQPFDPPTCARRCLFSLFTTSTLVHHTNVRRATPRRFLGSGGRWRVARGAWRRPHYPPESNRKIQF
jgi:hypothetical protein